MKCELNQGTLGLPASPDAFHLTIHADGIITMVPIPPLDTHDAWIWSNSQIAATMLSKLDEALTS